MSKNDDHTDDVPKMTPARDEIASFQRTKAKGSLVASLGEVPEVRGDGGVNSTVSKTLLGLLAISVILTASWAGYLHQKLTVAERYIQQSELRLADLESRLSVTDESMSESSVAMKVKVREMDSEIRKLWDNVWKKTKSQLAKHDVALKRLEQSSVENKAFITATRQSLTKNDSLVAELTKQLNSAATMQKTVVANQQRLQNQQTKLDKTADMLNRLESKTNVQDRRLKDAEEWVESINGFRRQVNRDISTLKKNVGQIQGGGA